MKKIFTILVFILFIATTSLAQNTADLFIENPTVNGSQTKFTWEIHITRTNSWGSATGANALGDCSWAFDYNSAGLANPVLTYTGSAVSSTQGYTNTVLISGGKVIVTTDLDRDNYDGVDLALNVKNHVYTVEMDITDNSLESDLVWDQINTGIFTARSDASVDETYYGSGDIPLPVELTSFSVSAVEGTKAKLEWKTATEINNYGFEIERAVVTETEDVKSEEETSAQINRSWEKVAFVKGHGNSNSTKIYSYTDKNLLGGSKFVYRLKQIDIDGTFEYSDEVEVEVLPTKYELFQNYPNPFNPSTLIKFSLPEDAKLSINIYNLLGEKVTTLLNKELKAGYHEVQFNSSSAGYALASGVYIYTIESQKFTQVKKMILMK